MTASAAWLVNGIWYSNVCRCGALYTIYPTYQAQPVGTSCAILNGFGQFVAYGVVSVN